MDIGEYIIVLLLAMPVVLALASMTLASARAVIFFCAVGTSIVTLLAWTVSWLVFTGKGPVAAGPWFMLDPLSAYHLGIMTLIFVMSAIYGISYFRDEIARGELTLELARRYGALWFGALGAMTLVMISNNLVIMWVGIEATTLLTAFLICIHISPSSLEAMWKYLLMCSVGVALAFIGTLLVAASASGAGLYGTDVLLWTNLVESAAKLNPALVKAGFIFIVVGYGTKAGLAPMHNWLPDAHSQAPAPVSAVFSGFLLNTALFCIIKYLPVVEGATGNTGWGRGILVVLGVLSILVAATFIVAQHDVKRLLAYHSVEHLGIIALGIGVGGSLGSFAALFHTFNHSLCKTLSFFCAGSLGQAFKTHDMRQMTSVMRVSPVWGLGLVASLLALIGVAPFSLFLSEFLILKAALDAGSYVAAAAFLIGLGVVFVGALRHVVAMAWEPLAAPHETGKTTSIETTLVLASLTAMLLLGIWMPQPLASVLSRAAAVIGGTI